MIPDSFRDPESLIHKVREALTENPEVFDGYGYLTANPDVDAEGIDALEHYLAHGFYEGRRPIGVLDPDWYLGTYPDVAASGLEPLTHYLLWGVKEGRLPRAHSAFQGTEFNGALALTGSDVTDPVGVVRSSGLFDLTYYTLHNPDVVAAPIDPIEHYLEHGEREGRRPNPWFDPSFYRCRYLNGAEQNSPLMNYIAVGSRWMRDPGPDFSAWHYWRENMQCEVGELDVLRHYLSAGRREGRVLRTVSGSDPALIVTSGVFEPDHYRKQKNGLQDNVWDLAVHYLSLGYELGLSPSPLFDADYYLENNSDVRSLGSNPFIHFLRHGWKELRNPSANFDVWWYWTSYMNPKREDVNPLAHFQTLGSMYEFAPTPIAKSAERQVRKPATLQRPVRRACLFAGHDPDDRIDEYVILFIAELSRHSHVYYLADGQMPDSELAKLAPYVRGAWSVQHGEYDFGSYARLANQFVGWDLLENYDEVLLVNDSSYLLRSLDEVFETMEKRDCDWWGLQATKGIAATRNQSSNLFSEPIAMDIALDNLVSTFQSDYTYDFLIGSYFVGLRAPVFRDESFRKFLANVRKENSKKAVVQKYEIGLTRLLLLRGYRPNTFIEDLYPFHPIFSSWYFVLLDLGFPLLKRYFLTQNHYQVPNLNLWEERVIDRFPDVDLDVIKMNLSRHLPKEDWAARWYAPLIESLNAQAAESLVAAGASIMEADLMCYKNPLDWVFLVDEDTSPIGDLAALLGETRRTPDLVITVLSVGDHLPGWIRDISCPVVDSPEGTQSILGAAVVIAEGRSALDAMKSFAAGVRVILDLTQWESGSDVTGLLPGQLSEGNNASICESVLIAESEGDVLRTLPHVPSRSFHDIWVTGHPRRDLLISEVRHLPEHLREPQFQVQQWAAERPLILIQSARSETDIPKLVVSSCQKVGACTVHVRKLNPNIMTQPPEPGDFLDHAQAIELAEGPFSLSAGRIAAAVVTDSVSIAFEWASGGITTLLVDARDQPIPTLLYGADWLALEARGAIRQVCLNQVADAVGELLGGVAHADGLVTGANGRSDSRAPRSQQVIKRLRQAAIRLPFAPSFQGVTPGASR